MSETRIAILGASGFLGSSLVERLFFEKKYDFTAFVHSYGNAWRIARLPIHIESLNILNSDEVERKLVQYSVVVNCTRGGFPVMLRGLKNILKASQKNDIEKFVHISSMAIYGNDPPPESSTENAQPNPGSNQYGISKLKQDKMVLHFHKLGVPAIILCPSNITGPYSSFLLGAIARILSNQVALVDGGEHPTNLIHIDNLVQAILAAIRSDHGCGERYFVNETEPSTWRDFYEELSHILDASTEFPSILRHEVLKQSQSRSGKTAFRNSVGILASREFREMLSNIPTFGSIIKFVQNLFYRLSPNIQDELRRKIAKPVVIHEDADSLDIHDRYITIQTRLVYHSPQKILSRLNYEPLLNAEQRRSSIKSWMNFFNLLE